MRNPWDRLVSAYHRITTNASNPKTREFGRRYVEPKGDFESFVRALQGAHYRWLIFGHVHFRPQHEMMSVNGKVAMDFVGRFETLQADMQRLAEMMPVQGQLGHENKSHHKGYHAYCTDETKRIAASLYEQDIDQFQYTF